MGDNCPRLPAPGIPMRHRTEMSRKATRVRTFEVCVPTHVALRMFIIMQVRASQLPFLANRNAEHNVSGLFWPVNCTAEWPYCLFSLLCSLGPIYEFLCISFRTDIRICFREVDHDGQHGNAARTPIRGETSQTDHT